MPLPSDDTLRAPFRRSLDSNPIAVREALADIVAFLADGGVSEDGRAQAELVFAEVLNNIEEHAYAGRDDGRVDVTILLTPQDARVDVRDRGVAMPDHTTPDGVAPDPADLPEGGFGWFLIYTLTQDLTYGRVADENRLTFTMALA